MAKKKGSKSGSGNGVAALAQKIDRLANALASQKASGKSGKKKRTRNRNRKKAGVSAGAIVLRSDYARAVLDPFNVRGARVPDSHMLRTGVSWMRSLINGGKQNFNFDSFEKYVYVNAAPQYMATGVCLVVAGTSPASSGAAPGSWFNIPAANTLNTNTYVVKGNLNFDAEAGTFNTYRVVGGGIRMTFTGGSEDSPILAYCVPAFNGDPWLSTYQDCVNYSTREWVIDRNRDTVTIPFPLRSTDNAYNWIKLSTHPSDEADDYPDEDGPFTTAQLRKSLSTAVSTDTTATNTAITAWSMQTGMGGLQVGIKVPPGCSWSAESIIHVEYTPPYQNAYGKGTLGDDSFEFCLSNYDEIQAVGNAVAASTQSTHSSHEGASNVLDDLKHLAKETASQAAQGVADALHDTQILREVVGLGVRGAATLSRPYMRRHGLGNTGPRLTG